MNIGPIKNQQPLMPAAGSVPPPPVEPESPEVKQFDSVTRLLEYAATQAPRPADPPLPTLTTAPPDPASWPDGAAIDSLLADAAKNVPDDSLLGTAADHYDTYTRREIASFQKRQARAEGSPTMTRLVHRQQLHGGDVEVHWNPNLNQKLQLFDMLGQDGLIRISDASSKENPDGPSMFGMALELYGRDGQPTDILMTGGTPLTEQSQARDPQAQLDLFNMIDPPSKVAGLARILWDEGVCAGPRMLLDVAHMRTSLDSVASLTAWSRAPFQVQGRDGNAYLVKMRAVPVHPQPALSTPGATSTERLEQEFKLRQQQGETRWRLEFQFMQPGDDVHDPRERWHGPWVAAAEIVVPRAGSATSSKQQWDRAENTKFSVWKNKDDFSTARDKNVLRPFGELNRARHAAYQMAGDNRGCPFLRS